MSEYFAFKSLGIVRYSLVEDSMLPLDVHPLQYFDAYWSLSSFRGLQQFGFHGPFVGCHTE